ncbi:MAG: prenyltransferase, partial [Lentisphaerae bacterium]|nr:prenyltransferase [Lentisphaerota bacterium]
GLACAAGYTAPPLKLAHRGAGEAVVGLAFGLLPVAAAYAVQCGTVRSAGVAAAGLTLAVLIAAVLFINEFPDAAADREAGKRNWVVRLGLGRAPGLYAVLASAWVVPLGAGLAAGALPAAAGAAALPLLLAVPAIRTARRHAASPRRLLPANRLAIVMHHAAGLLLAAALLLSRR